MDVNSSSILIKTSFFAVFHIILIWEYLPSTSIFYIHSTIVLCKLYLCYYYVCILVYRWIYSRCMKYILWISNSLSNITNIFNNYHILASTIEKLISFEIHCASNKNIRTHNLGKMGVKVSNIDLMNFRFL